MLIYVFLQCASQVVAHTVGVPLWPPCFYDFLGSCFWGHDEASVLAFEAFQRLTEACSRPDLGCKTSSHYEFGGEPRLPIMFTEPHKGFHGSCHVIHDYNHSWIVTFLGYHNIGGRSCSHDPRSMEQTKQPK